MGQKRRSAAGDLAEERQLDAELARLLCQGFAEARRHGAYVMIRLPPGLLTKFLEIEARNEKRRATK